MCGQYVFDSRGTCVCMCVWESKYVFARVFMTWHVRGCACVCACMCMHTWVCYGMHKDALCHAHEWVMSHDTHLIKAGRTCVSITSIVWMSHVTRTNKVVTHIHQGAGWKAKTRLWIGIRHVTRMSQVSSMNESSHTYESVMSHVYINHVTYMGLL